MFNLIGMSSMVDGYELLRFLLSMLAVVGYGILVGIREEKNT
jgi:hypothetical protein